MVPTMGAGVWSWGDTMWWNYGQSHVHEDIVQAYRTSLDAGFTSFDTKENMMDRRGAVFEQMNEMDAHWDSFSRYATSELK
jgi:hypothetical protein